MPGEVFEQSASDGLGDAMPYRKWRGEVRGGECGGWRIDPGVREVGRGAGTVGDERIGG